MGVCVCVRPTGDRGSFPPPQTGVSLGPLGQLENKGMTGLSCSYNDATLAIITAHFASDSHGRNKLAKRNAVCRRVLNKRFVLIVL